MVSTAYGGVMGGGAGGPPGSPGRGCIWTFVKSDSTRTTCHLKSRCRKSAGGVELPASGFACWWSCLRSLSSFGSVETTTSRPRAAHCVLTHERKLAWDADLNGVVGQIDEGVCIGAVPQPCPGGEHAGSFPDARERLALFGRRCMPVALRKNLSGKE